MNAAEQSELGYPENPIRARVLVHQEAEIPAAAAVGIALEIIGRRLDLPKGAYIDGSNVVWDDRHTGTTKMHRKATVDDHAALRVMHLVRRGS